MPMTYEDFRWFPNRNMMDHLPRSLYNFRLLQRPMILHQSHNLGPCLSLVARSWEEEPISRRRLDRIRDADLLAS